jgi:hypothetical protein
MEVAYTSIQNGLARIPGLLEHMLGQLTAVNASRRQTAAVQAYAVIVEVLARRVKAAADETNALEHPVLAAVSSAGGPQEVANMDYHARR